jgi:hypothetical protein
MIFGFNTDVKVGDTVYHVQSEARERESLLQTQVFVSGRCVAKRATSYAAAQSRPDFSTEQMHDLLRVQHREVLELVRAGRVEKVAVAAASAQGADSASHQASADEASKDEEEPAGLTLAWLNPGEFAADTHAALHFEISESGTAVADARVTVRVNGSAGSPQYAQGVTAADGRALVPVLFDVASHGDTVALLVQASAAGRSVTRKFQLRRTT